MRATATMGRLPHRPMRPGGDEFAVLAWDAPLAARSAERRAFPSPCMGLPSGRPGQALMQPGFRDRPVTFDSGGRDGEGAGCFVNIQAGEKLQLDDLAQARVECRQIVERLVQGK